MLEKSLLRRAARGSEIRLESLLNPEIAYVGFLSGIDEESYRLCLSKDGSGVFLPKSSFAIQDTGRTLEDLESEMKKTITHRISTFRKRATRTLEDTES